MLSCVSLNPYYVLTVKNTCCTLPKCLPTDSCLRVPCKAPLLQTWLPTVKLTLQVIFSSIFTTALTLQQYPITWSRHLQQHRLWPLTSVRGFRGNSGANNYKENNCNFSYFGLSMLLMILYPGHLGTSLGLTLFKLWSAPCLLINHNLALTHATHLVGCTVRVSFQDPKFLKLHWFFLKTKRFSEQLQLSWQSSHVCNLLWMFLACNWHSSIHARWYTIPQGTATSYTGTQGKRSVIWTFQFPEKKKLKVPVP